MTTLGPEALREFSDHIELDDGVTYTPAALREMAAQWEADRAALERARALLAEWRRHAEKYCSADGAREVNDAADELAAALSPDGAR